MQSGDWQEITVVAFVDTVQVLQLEVRVIEPPMGEVEISIPEAVDPIWMLTFIGCLPNMLVRHYNPVFPVPTAYKRLAESLRMVAEEEMAKHLAAGDN